VGIPAHGFRRQDGGPGDPPLHVASEASPGEPNCTGNLGRRPTSTASSRVGRAPPPGPRRSLAGRLARRRSSSHRGGKPCRPLVLSGVRPVPSHRMKRYQSRKCHHRPATIAVTGLSAVEVIPTTGCANVVPPMLPKNGASPNVNTPPVGCHQASSRSRRWSTSFPLPALFKRSHRWSQRTGRPEREHTAVRCQPASSRYPRRQLMPFPPRARFKAIPAGSNQRTGASRR